MKKLLFIALVISSITSFSKSNMDLTKTYTGPGDSLKVILSVKSNDRNINDNLRTTLNSISGTNVVAYCDNHAVFMLILDKTIIRDSNDLMVELKKLFPKTEDLLSFKDGDFNEFMKYCSPSNVDDASNLKKLATN